MLSVLIETRCASLFRVPKNLHFFRINKLLIARYEFKDKTKRNFVMVYNLSIKKILL